MTYTCCLIRSPVAADRFISLHLTNLSCKPHHQHFLFVPCPLIRLIWQRLRQTPSRHPYTLWMRYRQNKSWFSFEVLHPGTNTPCEWDTGKTNHDSALTGSIQAPIHIVNEIQAKPIMIQLWRAPSRLIRSFLWLADLCCSQPSC